MADLWTQSEKTVNSALWSILAHILLRMREETLYCFSRSRLWANVKLYGDAFCVTVNLFPCRLVHVLLWGFLIFSVNWVKEYFEKLRSFYLNKIQCIITSLFWDIIISVPPPPRSGPWGLRREQFLCILMCVVKGDWNEAVSLNNCKKGGPVSVLGRAC